MVFIAIPGPSMPGRVVWSFRLLSRCDVIEGNFAKWTKNLKTISLNKESISTASSFGSHFMRKYELFKIQGWLFGES